MTYPPQPPPYMAPAPPHPRSGNRKPLLIGCGVLTFLALLVFGGCAVLVGTAANDAAKTLAPSSPSGGGTKSKKNAALRTAGLGDQVQDGKFTFTVTKVKPGPRRIGDKYFGKEPQGKYVYVYVTVTNHGDVAQTFFGDNQKLLSGDKEYSADTEAAGYVKSSKSLWEEINPGNTVKGIIIFDVPKGVEPTALELHDSAFSGGIKVNLP